MIFFVNFYISSKVHVFLTIFTPNFELDDFGFSPKIKGRKISSPIFFLIFKGKCGYKVIEPQIMNGAISCCFRDLGWASSLVGDFIPNKHWFLNLAPFINSFTFFIAGSRILTLQLPSFRHIGK